MANEFNRVVRWVGNVARMHPGRLPQQMLYGWMPSTATERRPDQVQAPGPPNQPDTTGAVLASYATELQRPPTPRSVTGFTRRARTCRRLPATPTPCQNACTCYSLFLCNIHTLAPAAHAYVCRCFVFVFPNKIKCFGVFFWAHVAPQDPDTF